MKVIVKCRSTNKALFTGTIIAATGSTVTIKKDDSKITTFLLSDVVLSFE